MSTQEDARKTMAKSRQHDKNIQQNMLSRTEAEIESLSHSEIDRESRELIVEHRDRDRDLRQSMLTRSEAEISNTEN